MTYNVHGNRSQERDALACWACCPLCAWGSWHELTGVGSRLTISRTMGPFSMTYCLAKAVALFTDSASMPSTQMPAHHPPHNTFPKPCWVIAKQSCKGEDVLCSCRHSLRPHATKGVGWLGHSKILAGNFWLPPCYSSPSSVETASKAPPGLAVQGVHRVLTAVRQPSWISSLSPGAQSACQVVAGQ